METIQTCAYDNFLMGILYGILSYFLLPLVVEYIMIPIYEWIEDWCLDPTLGGWQIITCWFGWSSKLLVWILDLIPPLGWGVLYTIMTVVQEFSIPHVFHGIISLVIGVVMFFVTDIVFNGDDAISHKILEALHIHINGDGLLDKLNEKKDNFLNKLKKKKEEKVQSDNNQEEK